MLKLRFMFGENMGTVDDGWWVLRKPTINPYHWNQSLYNTLCNTHYHVMTMTSSTKTWCAGIYHWNSSSFSGLKTLAWAEMWIETSGGFQSMKRYPKTSSDWNIQIRFEAIQLLGWLHLWGVPLNSTHHALAWDSSVIHSEEPDMPFCFTAGNSRNWCKGSHASPELWVTG